MPLHFFFLCTEKSNEFLLPRTFLNVLHETKGWLQTAQNTLPWSQLLSPLNNRYVFCFPGTHPLSFQIILESSFWRYLLHTGDKTSRTIISGITPPTPVKTYTKLLPWQLLPQSPAVRIESYLGLLYYGWQGHWRLLGKSRRCCGPLHGLTGTRA